MFFSIKALEIRKVPFSEDFAPGTIDFQDQKIRQVKALHAEGTAELLSNTLGEVRIQGALSVEMETDCDRCLEPVRMPLNGNFDLFYSPMILDSHIHELAIGEAETQVGFYEGNGLDLVDVLREHILLSLPMQHVCSEACLGICPHCGKNRNQGDCGCAARLADDRWAALQAVKDLLPASPQKKN